MRRRRSRQGKSSSSEDERGSEVQHVNRAGFEEVVQGQRTVRKGCEREEEGNGTKRGSKEGLDLGLRREWVVKRKKVHEVVTSESLIH